MAGRVQVREIDDDEGRRLLRIVRRGTGSVVTWRRAHMVLPAAQGMSLVKVAGGRPRTFTLPERREIKKTAKSKPAEHGLPFSTWSLAKPADFLVAEGVVDDISHEGLRSLLREEGVSYQRVKIWKASRDTDCDRLYSHIKKAKNRSKFLEFCRYPRSLNPATVRIALVCDNYSPHLTTRRCRRVATWADANNVEIAYTPTNSSWLNRIEAQFTALRYFTLDGTDDQSHKEQGSMIRRYIIWRNKHARDQRLLRIINRANIA
ncbi:transposase [Embleya sp. NPDC056575]|uniref:transposase n=1 Tax=unclassified Embleya TaxID=2699296 RepID=UPI0036C0DC3C